MTSVDLPSLLREKEIGTLAMHICIFQPWFRIALQPDRTFSFVMSSPPTSYFLKAAAGIEKGAAQPGHETAGSVSAKHIYEIALVKAKDPAFEGVELQSVCRCVAASARSIGISITD